MYDLGDTVGLACDLKDENGDATNAVTVTLTITKPDGTAVSPAPSVTNPPVTTGHYIYDYVPTSVGLHTVRWVFATPTAAFSDVFDVRAASPVYVMSLADAKKHLNIPTTVTTDDEELREHLEAITEWIEGKVGPCVRRTYVDYVYPVEADKMLYTEHRQVLSVTSLTLLRDDSAPVTIADIVVNGPAGELRLPSAAFPDEPFLLTYVCGRTSIPSDIILAAKALLNYTWETQHGPLSGGPVNPTPYEMLAYSENIPPRAAALLQRHADRAGFA